MEIRTLKYFLAVAREQNMTEAAFFHTWPLTCSDQQRASIVYRADYRGI